MADVACFCGCLYSFDGGGGACPKCGQYATVMAGPAVTSTGRSRPGLPAAELNGAGHNGQTAGTRWDRVGAGPGLLAGHCDHGDHAPARGRARRIGRSRCPQS